MATKTYYLASGQDNSWAAMVDGTVQTAATRADGWTVAKIASANSCEFNAATKQASGSFSTQSGTPKPMSLVVGSPWNTIKSPAALTGTFAAAAFTLTFAVRATTASSQAGRMRLRVFKSANATGASATELTSATQVGTTSSALSTSADVTSVVTWTPAAPIVMNNEFLFFSIAWEITTASGSNSGDVQLRTGSAATPTGTVLVTSNWVPLVARPIPPSSNIAATSTVNGAINIGAKKLLTPSGSVPYSTQVLSLSPNAYYRLGDATAPTAVDLSPNARNGMYNGGVTLGQTGAITDGSKAAAFDGSTGWISIPSSVIVIPTPTSGFTFEIWYKGTDTNAPLITGRGTGNGAVICNLLLGYNGVGNSGTGIPTVIVRDLNSGGLATITAGKAVNDGVWHHIVATRSTSKLWTFYIDGAVSGTPAADTMTWATNTISACDLSAIGSERRWVADGQNTTDQQYLSGTVDDVAVYPIALSPAQVLANFQAGTPYAARILSLGPKAYWRFDSYVDSSGNGNVLTTPGTSPTGTASLVPTDPTSGAADIVVGQYFLIANSASLQLPFPRTLECWVNPRTVTGQPNVIRKDSNEYFLYFDNTYMTYGFYDGSANQLFGTYPAYVFSTGTRYHVVVTDDGTTVIFYVNGAVVKTMARGSSSTLTGTGPVALGLIYNGGTLTQGYDGKLDEVAIYNRALSATEVANNYLTGTSTGGPPQISATSTVSGTVKRLAATRPAQISATSVVGSSFIASKSFPATPILDNFNRANGAPGSNYSSGFGGYTLGTIASNQWSSSGSSVYWNPVKYGDSEIYFTVVTPQTTELDLFLHWAGQNGPGYYLEVLGSNWFIVKFDGSNSTSLASINTGSNLVAGSSVGFRIVGNVLTAYGKSSGGSWTQILQTTDSTYPAANYVGWAAEAGFVLDDFGGGTPVVFVSKPVTPAQISATSTVSGTIGVIRKLIPSQVSATSTVSGSIKPLRRILPAGISATSTVSGSVRTLHKVTPAQISAISTVGGAIVKIAAKLATLTDSFDTTLDKVTKWPAASAGTAWDAGAGGRAKIPCTASAEWLQTNQSGTYDLTSSSIFAKFTPPALGTGTREVWLEVQRGGVVNQDKFSMGLSGSTMYLRRWLAGSISGQTTIAYDNVNMAYWRIRESGGTTFMDTSPDGRSWTNQYSVANGFVVTSVWASLSSNYYGTETADNAYVDNVNFPIAAVVPTGISATSTVSGSVGRGSAFRPVGGAISATSVVSASIAKGATKPIGGGAATFPSTGVLDNFNRANASTLGVNWTADPFGFGLTSLAISGNQVVPAADQYGANWYSASTFGVNQEVFCTLTTPPSNNIRILLRLINPGTGNASGYALVPGPFDTGIYRIDNTGLNLLVNTGIVFANGDRAGLSVVGSTLTAYRNSGSGWTVIGTFTDTTYPGAGVIGLYSQDNSALVVDDFGGGTSVVGGVTIAATSTVSGSIRIGRRVAPAQITATSTMSSSVRTLRKVAPANISGTSTVSGSIVSLRKVAPAQISATSTVAGSIRVLRKVAPTQINATSTVATVPLTVLRKIAGLVNATSTVSGLITKLSGGPKPIVVTSINATSTVGASLTKLSGGPKPITPAQITANSTLGGVIVKSVVKSIVGAIAATSSISGIVAKGFLVKPTQINATSTVVSKVTTIHKVVGQINAISTVSGVINKAPVKPVAGNIAATSTISGIVSRVGAVKTIIGNIAAISTVNGLVRALRKLTPAGISAISTVVGNVAEIHKLIPAQVSATSSVTGSLATHPVKIVGGANVSATSTVSGRITALHKLAIANVSATSSVSGTVTKGAGGLRPLPAVQINAASTISTNVVRLRPVVPSNITAISNVNARVVSLRHLAPVQVFGNSGLAVLVTTRRRVSGQITATSVITAAVIRKIRIGPLFIYAVSTVSVTITRVERPANKTSPGRIVHAETGRVTFASMTTNIIVVMPAGRVTHAANMTGRIELSRKGRVQV